jgi:hypothetical protein
MNDFNESISTPRADAEGGMSALAKRAERFYRIDQIRHDQTRQRRVQRAFLSLDWRDEDGDAFDYGDCGRAAKKLYASLDAPFRKLRRELLFNQALDLLRNHPKLQRTLRAIRRFRRRKKIFSALQIRPEVYRRRFSDLTEILQIST